MGDSVVLSVGDYGWTFSGRFGWTFGRNPTNRAIGPFQSLILKHPPSHEPSAGQDMTSVDTEDIKFGWTLNSSMKRNSPAE